MHTGDCSRRFWRQSPNSATIVASVDRALGDAMNGNITFLRFLPFLMCGRYRVYNLQFLHI